jgi:hypothetical protein
MVGDRSRARTYLHVRERRTEEKVSRPFPQFTGRLASLGFSVPGGIANYIQDEGCVGIQTFSEIKGNEIIISGGKLWASNSNSGGSDFGGPSVLCLLCRFKKIGPPKDSLGFTVITKREFEADIKGALSKYPVTLRHIGSTRHQAYEPSLPTFTFRERSSLLLSALVL